jgi:hypothetical protein
MNNTLLLFMFSPNVDTYVNPITYCFENLDVTTIHLVHVKDAITGLTKDEHAYTLSNRVWEQLIALSNGKYINFSSDLKINTSDYSQISLSNQNTDIYKRVCNGLSSRQVHSVSYQDLKEGIEKIVKQNYGTGNCFLDVTAATKVPSIELFSIALALNISNFCVFELDERPDPSEPSKSLYHNVAKKHNEKLPRDMYKYTNLFLNHPIQASYSNLINSIDTDNKSVFIENTKLRLAELAKSEVDRAFRLAVFGMIFAWIFIFWLIQRIGWEFLEPWTYLIALATVIANYLYFAVKRHEFSPAAIYYKSLEDRKEKLFYKFGIKESQTTT